ncbi:MAG: hypothetical protein M1829_004046 [Trizodia sp. TS-e1964]|nr:MAG: hypothetical protein M1829_004046 [Trizodia sp. TS-e1964]
MDALLSLPFLSYLFAPSMGVYSTSLNLFFFYMTWATLVLSHPPVYIEVIGSLAIRVLFFLIPSTLFFLFDMLVPSLASSIKTQGPAALPTKGARMFGVALQTGVEEFLIRVLHYKSALRVTTTLPYPWAIVKDVFRGMIVREVLQYYIHTLALHTPSSPISKYHERWHHEVRAPYSFIAHYDHPVSWILLRWLPVYGPAMLFRFHLLTYFVFLAIISCEEAFSYSGYSTMPSILLGGIARRQDLHMASRGEGNFAPWGILDWINSTSVGADIGDDIAEELDQQDIQRKWEDAKVKGKEKVSRRRLRSSRD